MSSVSPTEILAPKRRGRTWGKGVSGNPLGAPKRATERAYVEQLRKTVPPAKWAKIVARIANIAETGKTFEAIAAFKALSNIMIPPSLRLRISEETPSVERLLIVNIATEAERALLESMQRDNL